MSDPKVKFTTNKKAGLLLNRISGVMHGVGMQTSGVEKVRVITGTVTRPTIKDVVVQKSLFTTYPSERSVDFMRRSDEATSAGAWLGGRRHGG